MNVNTMRGAAALLLALGLAACGGSGKETFTLGGTISGLAYSGLELTNTKNGDKFGPVPVPADPAAATPFAMPQRAEYGDEYNIQVTQEPLNQTCTPSRNADTAGRLDAINITITCATNTFSIGGKVSGLTENAAGDTTLTGLVINNGADQLAIEKNGDYVLNGKVPFGKTYGVSILRQPTNANNTGVTCRIENPSGTVNAVVQTGGTVKDPVNNINVICTR